MDLGRILDTIQPFLVMFVALFVAFLTAIWVSAIIWTFRDIRSRSRDVFAQILATFMVLLFFPLFPLPGWLLYLILRPRESLAQIYERTLEEEALLQGIEERLACPACNRRIEEDYLVCPSCHTRLKKGCTSCGRLLHLSWSICPYCGAAQTTTRSAPSLPRQPVAIPFELPADDARLSSPVQSSLPQPAAESAAESETSEEYDTGTEIRFEAEAPAGDEVEQAPEAETRLAAEAMAGSEADQASEAEIRLEAETPAGGEADQASEAEIRLEAETPAPGEVGPEPETEPIPQEPD